MARVPRIPLSAIAPGHWQTFLSKTDEVGRRSSFSARAAGRRDAHGDQKLRLGGSCREARTRASTPGRRSLAARHARCLTSRRRRRLPAGRGERHRLGARGPEHRQARSDWRWPRRLPSGRGASSSSSRRAQGSLLMLVHRSNQHALDAGPRPRQPQYRGRHPPAEASAYGDPASRSALRAHREVPGHPRRPLGTEWRRHVRRQVLQETEGRKAEHAFVADAQDLPENSLLLETLRLAPPLPRSWGTCWTRSGCAGERVRSASLRCWRPAARRGCGSDLSRHRRRLRPGRKRPRCSKPSTPSATTTLESAPLSSAATRSRSTTIPPRRVGVAYEHALDGCGPIAWRHDHGAGRWASGRRGGHPGVRARRHLALYFFRLAEARTRRFSSANTSCPWSGRRKGRAHAEVLARSQAEGYARDGFVSPVTALSSSQCS